eukprot:TRINITY_DN19173_c2_g1_i1.p1 TRINITY_DN19173_c2_g1~~TRINITY_DN19173_c2_g1_i1.p1  ORF type:complete len:250 (+),score=66.08 TRINITY_DN19173_c2_g1_i1:101-850(+)
MGPMVGALFVCNGGTRDECMQRMLFGAPGSRVRDLMQLPEGTPIFLHDMSQQSLLGVYRSQGPGGENLEPDAFGGRFPAQVRVAADSEIVELRGREWQQLINWNGRRAAMELNATQVAGLQGLVRRASGRKSIGDGPAAPAGRGKPAGAAAVKPMAKQPGSAPRSSGGAAAAPLPKQQPVLKPPDLTPPPVSKRQRKDALGCCPRCAGLVPVPGATSDVQPKLTCKACNQEGVPDDFLVLVPAWRRGYS